MQLERAAVARSGAWVASATVNNLLKCWSVPEDGVEVFSIQLNVKVKELHFMHDDAHLTVLGERGDGTTKVLVFKILQ